jgi:hypothetical protein
MPILLLLVAILLIASGINGKVSQLAGLVKEDFAPSQGAPGFLMWLVALFVAGSLGYIRSFKPVANAFLVLIVISMLLSNRGFFSQFSSAIKKV